MNSSEIYAEYGQLFGSLITRVEKGQGSFVFLHFVSSSNSDGSEPDGKFWIYLCDWVLKGNDRVIVSSDTVSKSNADLLAVLVGKRLKVIEADAQNHRIGLEFGENLSLLLEDRPDVYGNDAEMLMLFARGKHINTFFAFRGVEKVSQEERQKR